MENENRVKNTVDSLMSGIDGFLAAKTVIGEPIHIADMVIMPMADVSFALGAGAFGPDKKKNDGGGAGGRMTPCAMLIIQNGSTKLVNIKNQDGMTKLLELVPDLMSHFSSGSDRQDTGEGETAQAKKREV